MNKREKNMFLSSLGCIPCMLWKHNEASSKSRLAEQQMIHYR